MTVCKPHGGAPLLSPPSLSGSGYLVRQGVQSGTPLPLQQSPPAAERQMCRIEQNRITGIIAFKIQKSQTDGLTFFFFYQNMLINQKTQPITQINSYAPSLIRLKSRIINVLTERNDNRVGRVS